MSYGLVSKLEDNIIKMNFKIAIADEAHYLKNSKSKRSETLIPILSNCKHVILMSGTPALNRPRELFPLL